MGELSTVARTSDQAVLAPSPPVRPAVEIAHLFKACNSTQHCLTRDRTGSNIPRGMGLDTWSYIKDVQINPGEYRRGFDAQVAANELARFGYYLVGSWYKAD